MLKKMGLILFSALALNAHADEASVKAKLGKLYPELKIVQMDKVPNVGLYQFVYDGAVAPSYTNENVDYVITGPQVNIMDPKTKKNMTEELQVGKVKDVFNHLPFNESFSVKYGKGTRKIALFTDPDCPYCKQLEADLKYGLANAGVDVTLYYFMNPLRIQGHENAPAEAKKILCADNPATAWQNFMLNGALPNNPGTCSKASLVEKQKNMAESFGFNSTPTLMFDNGYIVRQGIKPQQIKEILNKRQP